MLGIPDHSDIKILYDKSFELDLEHISHYDNFVIIPIGWVNRDFPEYIPMVVEGSGLSYDDLFSDFV